MTTNFLLSGTLTDFQIKLLDLIQYLHQEAEKANKVHHRIEKPVITLQYAYIAALFKCSHTTITNALDRLYEVKLIDEVTKNYNQCTTYRYNPNVYHSLLQIAKARYCTLVCGRPKKGTPRQKKEVKAETVIKYMTGKAITKANKRASRHKHASSSNAPYQTTKEDV